MERTHRSTTANLAVAMGVVLAAGAPAFAQSYRVQASYLRFFPATQCWGGSSGVPFEVEGECPDNSGPGGTGWNLSGTGTSSGPELGFSISASHTLGGCCIKPFSVSIDTKYDQVSDLVITGSQAGPVTAQCNVSFYAVANLWYDCGGCPPLEPSVPEVVEFYADVASTAGDRINIHKTTNGWHHRTWTGTFNLNQSRAWSAGITATIDLSKAGVEQQSYASAHAILLMGPVNADGSVGPVFTFPDCPTCTANAPSIGLVNNYFVPAPGTCVADVDGDGATDVFDFAEFAANFGRTDLVPGTGGDMDYDGDCDVLDFGAFAADFGCGD